MIESLLISKSKTLTFLIRVCVIALAYALAGKLGLMLANVHDNVTLIWLPSGIAIAALLLGGLRLWPGVAIGALLLNGSTDISLLAALGIAVGNSLGAIAGAYLLRRADFHLSLDRIRDVLLLASVATILSTMVNATLGTLILVLSGEAPADIFVSIWLDWWLGDALGVILVLPVILVWSRPAATRPSAQTTVVLAVFTLMITAVSLAGLSGSTATGEASFPLAGLLLFAPFPYIICVAIRYGLSGVTTAALVFALVNAGAAANDLGPLVAVSSHQMLVLLNGYIITIALIGLLTAATISEHKRTEQALLQSETRLAEAQRISHLGGWEREISSGKIWWSDEVYRIFGIDKKQGPMIYERALMSIHPEDREAFKAAGDAAVEGAPYNLVCRVVHPDGTVRHVRVIGDMCSDESGASTHLKGTVQDITEEREFQARIAQVSKLASLGEMATGIAHELNQPLNIIRMTSEASLELLKNVQSPGLDIKTKLERISNQTVRAAAIIDHMCVFGRTPEDAQELFLPTDAAIGAVDLIGDQMRHDGIQCSFDFPKDCPRIKGVQMQLEQVLLNLLSNARTAIEDNQRTQSPYGGRVHIQVLNDVQKNEIKIVIEDNGGGIPEKTQHRVFEPFFTTKEPGKGTGLGLSISYGIINSMNGTIDVTNRNDGACFTIHLPVGDGYPVPIAEGLSEAVA